jgi:hypothetical protein
MLRFHSVQVSFGLHAHGRNHKTHGHFVGADPANPNRLVRL